MKLMNYEAVKEKAWLFNAIMEALPGCVIAGGYLRDLLLDKPTRDIDILVGHMPTSDELDALDKVLNCVLWEQVIAKEEDYVPEGGRTSDVQAVFKTDDDKVEVIVVDDVLTHIDEFPDNISKVYFIGERLVTLPEFVEGHANKHITYRATASPVRLDKLKAKYPDYMPILWSSP